MMHYTNRNQFIMSAHGCMSTNPDSLESIMAGNENGASGCIIALDTTEDGIAVLCTNGGFTTDDSTFHAVNETDFFSLRRMFPKMVAVGQAVELAKSCGRKIGIEIKSPQVCIQAMIALRQSNYLEQSYIGGLDPANAARIVNQHPELHVMAEIDAPMEETATLVQFAQQTGLFGIRAEPKFLTPTLCEQALLCGLFLASKSTSDPEEMAKMYRQGVNFIETDRPDIASALLPQLSQIMNAE